MQREFRESAVKVLRFSQNVPYVSLYVYSVKVRTYVYQRPRLEETRDRDRESFQSGAGNLCESLSHR